MNSLLRERRSRASRHASRVAKLCVDISLHCHVSDALIASVPYGHRQPYNASNVLTRNRQSKKHSNLWTARMVNSGRVTTLSPDFPMPRFTGCRTVSRAHPSRPTAARSTRREVLAFGSAASSRAQGLSESQPIALPNSSAASRRRARISAEPHRSMVPSSLPGAPCLYNQILRPPSTLIEYLGPTAR